MDTKCWPSFKRSIGRPSENKNKAVFFDEQIQEESSKSKSIKPYILFLKIGTFETDFWC